MLLVAAVCAGGQGDSDETLARLRKMVLDQAERIPNYTCVQTIDRQFFHPGVNGPHGVVYKFPSPGQSCSQIAAGKRKNYSRLIPIRNDRFRLDVRVGAGTEMYSWVGASRFGDRPLRELVGFGPTSTGAFGPMLTNIVADAPDVRFGGEKAVSGRRLYAYSFRVPIERSHHSFEVLGGSHTAIAYEGTILADPATGAPVQLTVLAGELPTETGCCGYSAELDYSPVRIGAAEFLLPKTARQRFAMPDGREVENTVTFSACREYLAESAVAYQGMPTPAPAASGNAAPPPVDIPAGLPVAIALTGGISSDVAAAGDPFTGRLAKPLVDPLEHAIAPGGATVHGRIASLVRSLSPERVTIHLTMETVEIGGREVPFRLTGRRDRVVVVTGPPAGGLQSRGVAIGEMPRGPSADYVELQHSGTRWVIPDGFLTNWVTAGPP